MASKINHQLTSSPKSPVRSPAHITVFGASRGVGLAVVEQAVARGLTVTAVSRGGPENPLPQVEYVQGEVEDPEIVRQSLRRSEAAVITLGASALSRSQVRSRGTASILSGMREQGLRRVLCLSLLGAAETREDLPFFLRNVMFPLYLRRPVAEHEKQEALLSESGLDWTVLRPPFLIDGPVTKRYEHGFGKDLSHLTLKISRADVAHFLIEHLGRSDYIGRAVGISYAKDLKVSAAA